MLKKRADICGKLPFLSDTKGVTACPLYELRGRGSKPNALQGKKFLYVSLLMVLLGPFRDPFFWAYILKNNMIDDISRTNLDSGRLHGMGGAI